LHFHIKHQTQIADPVGVQGMTGASRFRGVVSDLGARLVAVEQFDGGVDVENPGLTERFAAALRKRRVHPCRTLCQLRRPGSTLFGAVRLGLVRRQMRQGAAQTFIADDLVHAENLRRDLVAA
jgi:hypothetical protein